MHLCTVYNDEYCIMIFFILQCCIIIPMYMYIMIFNYNFVIRQRLWRMNGTECRLDFQWRASVWSGKASFLFTPIFCFCSCSQPNIFSHKCLKYPMDWARYLMMTWKTLMLIPGAGFAFDFDIFQRFLALFWRNGMENGIFLVHPGVLKLETFYIDSVRLDTFDAYLIHFRVAVRFWESHPTFLIVSTLLLVYV